MRGGWLIGGLAVRTVEVVVREEDAWSDGVLGVTSDDMSAGGGVLHRRKCRRPCDGRRGGNRVDKSCDLHLVGLSLVWNLGGNGFVLMPMSLCVAGGGRVGVCHEKVRGTKIHVFAG